MSNTKNTNNANNQKISNGITWVLFILFFLLSGALLLFTPNNAANVTAIAIGVVLCLLGVKNVIAYFNAPVQETVHNLSFGVGLLAVFGGILILIKPQNFEELLKYAWSVGILIGAFFKLQVGITMLRIKAPMWWLGLALAGASLVMGFIAFFAFANAATTTSNIVLGIFLWAEAAMDVFCYFHTEKLIKHMGATAAPAAATPAPAADPAPAAATPAAPAAEAKK